MKCRRCKEVAIIDLPSHNFAFCKECFLMFFEKQIQKGIEEFNLISEGDKVLVALSGGKDSLVLMLVLSKLGYDVTGFHIDLAIGQSSIKAREVCERFCEKHGLTLVVKEMAKEGLAIPSVKRALKRPICSVCGKIKRYYFNQTARELGFDSLATGHNLDDEIARLTSNTLRWDRAYLSDQGPFLPEAEGFRKKIKPLWRVTEYESAHYSFLMGIENHYAPCPYSSGASFSVLKSLWVDLELAMPGRKIDFYQGFLTRGRPAFQAEEKIKGKNLEPCETCGYPTSSGSICGVCRIRLAVEERVKEMEDEMSYDFMDSDPKDVVEASPE